MSMSTTGATEVVAQMDARRSAFPARAEAIRRHYAHLVVTAIQARIVKRSGDLAGSYHVNAEGNVRSEHPAAWRHEMGFHSADSLGRHFSQTPHPAVGPAADEIGPSFEAAALKEFADL